MRRTALGTGLAFTLVFASCRPSPQADLSWCAPADSRAVALVRLDSLRALPPVAAFVELLPPDVRSRASSLLLAWDGSEILAAAAGQFPQPPAGAVMAGPGIALIGSPAITAAALSQFRTGRPGAGALLSSAAELGAGCGIRAAIRGDAALPLSGNLANLNRLLRMSESIALGLRLGGPVELTARAACRNDDDAARMEQTVRALLLLARAGRPPGQRPDAWSDSVRIARAGRTLTLSLSLTESEASRLMEGWLPRPSPR